MSRSKEGKRERVKANRLRRKAKVPPPPKETIQERLASILSGKNT